MVFETVRSGSGMMNYNAFDLLISLIISIALATIIFIVFTPQPKPLQNVVCDTSYGVQYFEHKGYLTLRVNHEGVPIRCFE